MKPMMKWVAGATGTALLGIGVAYFWPDSKDVATTASTTGQEQAEPTNYAEAGENKPVAQTAAAKPSEEGPTMTEAEKEKFKQEILAAQAREIASESDVVDPENYARVKGGRESGRLSGANEDPYLQNLKDRETDEQEEQI